MPKYSTAFGMDVHLRSTTVCALDADTGEAVTRRFPGNPWGEVAGWMDGFPGPSLAAYESGYLGFAPQRELAGLGAFVHRTFNGSDLRDFVLAIRRMEQLHGGIGAFFEERYAATCDLPTVLAEFRREFFAAEHAPRCEKHLSSIERGAACKRLCMYLRWMVRRDARGVDFGLWSTIPMSALRIPLDVHVGETARALGLLTRRQNDWRAVEETTAALRRFDAADPVRFDFALFGIGVDAKRSLHDLLR